MISEPLVSVITVTYNHELFIGKAIEGVLMQKTNFPFELIIAEDCSTDRTKDIIDQYAKIHTDIIRVITSEKNIGGIENEKRAMEQAQGKYIALCEGDDYWTVPYKLQTQIDFLEKHSEYSLTCHRCKYHDVEANKWSDDLCGFLFEKKIDGVDFDADFFLKHWITQPLTTVYRKDSFDLNYISSYKYYRDMHLFYHILQKGKGYLFPFVGGVYNFHQGGIHSKTDILEHCIMGVNISKELYLNNKTQVLKEYYEKNLLWAISFITTEHKSIKISLGFIKDHYILSHSFWKLMKDCKRLIKSCITKHIGSNT